MLKIIAYAVIILVVLLIVFYIYLEVQRKKLIEYNKRAVALRLAKLKNNFKADLKELIEQEVLTIPAHDAIFRIANNFFVFQPVSTKSINYCQQLLNEVIAALPTDAPDSNNFDSLQKQVILFAKALPVSAGGYNGNFYREELPKLVNTLIDSLDNIRTAEDEIENIEQDLTKNEDSSQFTSVTAA